MNIIHKKGIFYIKNRKMEPFCKKMMVFKKTTKVVYVLIFF